MINTQEKKLYNDYPYTLIPNLKQTELTYFDLSKISSDLAVASITLD